MKRYLLLLLLLLPFTVFAKAYEIVEGDLDTVGSIVKIGTEEFYVAGKEDDTHIKLFSRYLINPNTMLQDKNLVKVTTEEQSRIYGFQFAEEEYYFESGTIEFTPNYTYEQVFDNEKFADVYDSNASIKTYVDKYNEYLESQCVSTTSRLITRADLKELGCYDGCFECNRILFVCGSTSSPSWTHDVEYVMGTAVSYSYNSYINGVHYSSPYGGVMYMTDQTGNGWAFSGGPRTAYGLRPLVILDISKENECPIEEPVVEEETKEEIKGVEENPKTGVVTHTLLILLLISVLSIIFYTFKDKTYFNE